MQVKATQKDRSALQSLKILVDVLKRETVKAMPEYTASDWQFQSMIESRGRSLGLTYGRLKRLVALGWVLKKPSDGHGPELKVAE